MQITEEQVRQAEEKAAQQEQVRDDAARALESDPHSELKALKHTEETRLAAQCRASAREIREAYSRQMAAQQVSRTELETSAAAEIAAAEQDLGAAQARVVEAADQAQRALADLVDVAGDYAAAIGVHADALAAKRLGLSDGGTGGDRTSLDDPRVRVAGVLHQPVDPGAVAAWVLRRVVEARLSHQHYLMGALAGAAMAMAQRAPEVVTAVPDVAPVKRPTRERMTNALQALRGSK